MTRNGSMVLVRGGTFVFGQKEPQPKNLCGHDYLMPEQTAELAKFYIDQHEVTNAQYAAFVRETGHRPPSHWRGRTPPEAIANAPVANVSWKDAGAYAAWAGKRLPTEQEWEYATRGSDGRLFPWGNDEPEPRHAIFFRHTDGPVAVGSCPAGISPFGCLDMAGNVLEWTATPIADTSEYVIRGGEWTSVPENLRCSHRFAAVWDTRSPDLGFRCVAKHLPPDAVQTTPSIDRNAAPRYRVRPYPVTRRPALGMHPRVFTSPDEKQTVLERIETNRVAKAGWRIVRSWTRLPHRRKPLTEYADKLEAGDPEAKLGYSDWELLGWLGVCCWLDNDAEDGRLVSRVLAAHCKRFQREQPPDAARLDYASLPFVVFCYDFAGAALSSELRVAVRDLMIRSCRYEVERARVNFYGLGRPAYYRAFDWTPLFLAPVGMTALALEGEMDDAERLVWERMATGAAWDYFEHCIGEDGSCPDGQAYFGFANQSTGYFLTGLQRRGHDLYRHPHLRRVPDWLAQLVLPWRGVFNSIGKSFLRPTVGQFIVSLHDAYRDNPAMAWVWTNHGGVHPYETVAKMFWGHEPAAVDPDRDLPLARYFPSGELVTSRSDWSPEAVYFATRYGREVHCQTDTSSFTLYGYGAAFAIDGGGTPREFAGHNVVLIDGKGAGDELSSTVGRILHYADGPLGTVAVGDAKSAYDYYHKFDAEHRVRCEGITVQRALRTFVFLRGAGAPPYLVVVDDIRKDDDPHDYTWLMHATPKSTFVFGDRRATMTAAEFKARGNHAPRVPASPGSKRLLAFACHPNAVQFSQSEYATAAEYGPHPRLEMTARAVNPQFRILLLPMRSDTPEPSVHVEGTETAQLLTVQWPEATDHWHFSTGAAPDWATPVQTDATVAVIRQRKGRPTGFAFVQGTHLTFRGLKLFRSEGRQTLVSDVAPDPREE